MIEQLAAAERQVFVARLAKRHDAVDVDRLPHALVQVHPLDLHAHVDQRQGKRQSDPSGPDDRYLHDGDSFLKYLRQPVSAHRAWKRFAWGRALKSFFRRVSRSTQRSASNDRAYTF